jgi:hypothetical protein
MARADTLSLTRLTDQLLGTGEMNESGALRCFHQVMGDISQVDGTTS